MFEETLEFNFYTLRQLRHMPSTPDLELRFFSQSQPVYTAPSYCSFPIATLMDTLAPLQLPLLLPTPTPTTLPVLGSRKNLLEMQV